MYEDNKRLRATWIEGFRQDAALHSGLSRHLVKMCLTENMMCHKPTTDTHWGFLVLHQMMGEYRVSNSKSVDGCFSFSVVNKWK